jgi:hypothetical protein
MNLYRYVGNTPTDFTDPDGLARMPAPQFPPKNGLKPFPKDPRPLPTTWNPIPNSEDPDSGNPTEYKSDDPNGPGGKGPSAHWDGDSQPPHWDINYPDGSDKRCFKPGGDELDPRQRHGPRNEMTDPAPVRVPNPPASAAPPNRYPPNPRINTLPWYFSNNPAYDVWVDTGLGAGVAIIGLATSPFWGPLAAAYVTEFGSVRGVGALVPR